jgi:hypothetical protein
MTARKRIRWQAREAWGAVIPFSSDRCFHHRPYASDPSTPRHHTVRGCKSILRDGIARRITFARLAMLRERLNGLGTECGPLRTVASRLCHRASIMCCRRSGLRNWTRQIVYYDTKPEPCFKELHGPRSHAGEGACQTILLSGEIQLARTVLPTKILGSTQTGNKPFVNVNGPATCRVT